MDIAQQIRDGTLTRIRETTGLSRNHMAHLIGVNPQRIVAWETGQWARINEETGRRVQTVIDSYQVADSWLKEENIPWRDIRPVRQVAMEFGVGVLALGDWCHSRQISPIDLGALGTWLTLEDIATW